MARPAARSLETDLSVMNLPDHAPPRGMCELVCNEQHLDVVVRRAIKQATASLDVMTADLKAMLVPDGASGGRARRAPSIITHFADLAKRGVEVRILHGGVPSGAALNELNTLKRKGWPERLALRRCPRLHSKAVIVDAAAMYLGSANLTGAGLGAKGATRRNFELGVWTESPDLIDATLDQFNALWEGERCTNCGRRDVCPEPLEAFGD